MKAPSFIHPVKHFVFCGACALFLSLSGIGCGSTAEAARGTEARTEAAGTEAHTEAAGTEARTEAAETAAEPETIIEPTEPAAAEPAAFTEQEEEGPAPAGGYTAPGFKDAYFDAGEAYGDNGVEIDLSGASEGYVAVSAYSEDRLKFQVLKGDSTYTYDISSEGEPSVFPIQSGDGHYTFRVMENISGTKYAILYQTEEDVSLEDEFQPFLRPSDYANYTSSSACVKRAAELAAKASDQNDFIGAVFKLVCKSVKYDKQKAETVQSGYLPDPDETLSTGKGICFDYASLTAAMLRSQGVPCKVIFGYVSPDDLYHAWNMIYTESDGWVTVEFKVSGDTWSRMDLTFSANGAGNSFIGDGSNYADVYCY